MGYLISNLEQVDSFTEIKQNTTTETFLCVLWFTPQTHRNQSYSYSIKI